MLVIDLLGQLLAQRDQQIAALKQRVSEMEAAQASPVEPTP